MSEENKNASPGQEIEALAQLGGAKRMTSDGMDARDVQPDVVAAVIERTKAFMEATGRKSRQIAESMGWSPPVISQFLSGKYAGDRGQVTIDLDRFITAEEELASRPHTTQYVWTTVAMRIKGAAYYCLEGSKEKRTIGMVYAPESSGLGKTLALQAIHRELTPRRSAYLTVDKVDANPTGFLDKLCGSVRVETWGSNAQKFRRLCQKVENRSFIFLIDQIHNLRNAKQDKPFYILMDLYDRTETAQLWAGTADLVDYLEKQQRRDEDESRAQIRSRIFPRVDLMDAIREGGSGDPLFTVEEIRKIFGKNQLRLVGGSHRFLCQLANTPDSGGLRLCVHIVEFATMLALKRGRNEIDERLLAEAMRAGFQPRRTQLILDQISIREGSGKIMVARAG